MSEATKAKLISALQTFVSAFLTAVGATLATGEIQWTWAFLGSILLAAVRVALKAVWEKSMPVSFGGVK